MRYLYKIFFVLFALIPISVLVSCQKDNIEPEPIPDDVISELSGTRWSIYDWDYSIGDDYVTINEGGTEYIFYSSTHGAIYEWSKVSDSDYGNTHNRSLSFFTYKCNGSDIDLKFIVPTSLSSKTLKYKNGTISEINGTSYFKLKFDKETSEWLSGNHGTTGECEWYYDLKNTLVITGNGKMADYSSWNETPWSKLTKHHVIDKVEIIDKVKNVGNYAFSCPTIYEASLSSEIESIGVGAFSGSTLSSIWITSSVKEIKADAFANCKYLKNINGMYELEIIGDCAFSDCKEISLGLTKKLRSIGKMAFLGCNVTSFTKSEELVSIETGAFSNCSFSTLTLPNSLKYLGNCAFSSTKINTIKIGSGLTTVSGTPFFVASSGKIYIDKNAPLNLSDDLIDGCNKWTLYVPSGSKNAYSKANYWKNFKNIYEDSTLSGDGTIPDESSDDPKEDASKYKGNLNGHEWVDLGLSVKWATLNVGASNLTNAGDYFNWKRSTTDWETDSWDSAGEAWSGTYEDPIYKLWGKGWMTPTKEQFEELINNCTFSQVKENGVTCIKVVSKKNSQYIIIPLSGRMDGFRDYGDTSDELNLFGKVGYLWTASSEKKSNGNIAYGFAVEIPSLKTYISSRNLCQNIYTYYSRIPMRGVCK